MGDQNKPIKVDQTLPQIQHPKKKRFLEFYRETRGHISNSARAAEIDRTTYYEWMKTDPIFALLKEEEDAELNDDMREALIQKGADGDLGAIIFYLRNRHPEFKNNIGNNVAIQVNFGDLANKQKDNYGIE